jgi:hypothetical protein
MKEKKRN